MILSAAGPTLAVTNGLSVTTVRRYDNPLEENYCLPPGRPVFVTGIIGGVLIAAGVSRSTNADSSSRLYGFEGSRIIL